MVVDSFAGIVIKILMPHDVYDHFIGEYTLGVHDQQGEYVKLLCGQFDFLPRDADNAVLQTKMQISYMDLGQCRFNMFPRIVVGNDNMRIVNIGLAAFFYNILYQIFFL